MWCAPRCGVGLNALLGAAPLRHVDQMDSNRDARLCLNHLCVKYQVAPTFLLRPEVDDDIPVATGPDADRRLPSCLRQFYQRSAVVAQVVANLGGCFD